MGPAEVSTWAIVRTFWGEFFRVRRRLKIQLVTRIVLTDTLDLSSQDIFAASMEGICCAAEIRCAYHIGKGHIPMARRSSFKSLLIGKLLCIEFTFFI